MAIINETKVNPEFKSGPFPAIVDDFLVFTNPGKAGLRIF